MLNSQKGEKMRKKKLLIIACMFLICGLSTDHVKGNNANENNNSASGTHNNLSILVCEATTYGVKIKTEIKYNGNVIKNLNTEVFMGVGATMINDMYSAMKDVSKEITGTIKGFTYDVNKENNGIRIIQKMDYTEFNATETNKLAEKLGMQYGDFPKFEGEGDGPDLEKYRQQMKSSGFTCE
jgi:hypothetical protein